MSSSAIVWIARDEAADLRIKGTEFPCRVLEINTLIYEMLKSGSPRDIVVLPFLRNFAEIVGHIRGRGISGPVIIYTNSETMEMNLLDYAAQGIIFLDPSRFTRPMVLGFITFLQKQQEMVSIPEESTPKYTPPPVRLSQNPEEIRPLFRRILQHRAKILLTCQFRDDLPTLTATCDIIQMVGEIETKIVLDNFSPEEFVSLYNQFGKGRPLSGFFTREEETVGFDFAVSSCRMGKITVLLPERIYEQKRKFFRVEPDPKAPVIAHILPEGYHTVSVSVRDVSEGGVGLISPYTEIEKHQVCPMALALPSHRILMGTAEVMFKGEIKGGSCSYGMSLMFHPSDHQYLQHYVFKRQAGILATIRNLAL
jgi:hypothetical protein